MKSTLALLSLVAVCGAGSAVAQTPAGVEPAPGRYQFQPVEGGLAKLDTATGEITICRVDPDRMVCDPAAAAGAPGPAAAASAVPIRPPADDRDDEEFDKALDRMKRVFRAFGDVAREFEGDDRAPPAAQPNRT